MKVLIEDIKAIKRAAEYATQRTSVVYSAKTWASLNWVAVCVTRITQSVQLVSHTTLVEREGAGVWCTELLCGAKTTVFFFIAVPHHVTGKVVCDVPAECHAVTIEVTVVHVFN